MEEPERPLAPPSVRDHLANERTLLSWIRTALTVIGLGFIVDRLAAEGQRNGIAAFAGVGLVLLGGVVALAGPTRTSARGVSCRRELTDQPSDCTWRSLASSLWEPWWWHLPDFVPLIGGSGQVNWPLRSR